MVGNETGTVLVSLTERVCLAGNGDGCVTVVQGARTLRLKSLDPGVSAALRRIPPGDTPVHELAAIAAHTCPHADLARLDQEVARLAGKGLVRFSCVVAGQTLLEAIAKGPLARFDFSLPAPAQPVCLSRFAYAHRVGDAMTLDSPASYAQVRICQPTLGSLLAALAAPQTLTQLTGQLPGFDPVALRAALRFLLAVGVIAPADESGLTAQENEPAVRQREFHDVVLHTASRHGLTEQVVGGTYRFGGVIPPEPAIRPLPPGRRVPLPVPDLAAIVATDPPLAQVMETRRSIRKHGADPISVGQLGEFLFRVARAKSVRPIDEVAGDRYETSDRTYPSGGATYDLDLYLTIRCCSGLEPGIFHYDPLGHQLTHVCGDPQLIRGMLLDAYFASGMKCEPQVLITLASRFGRAAWKYQGLAYSLTLKNAGVLYEAMYLAATAMGLAPCGGGCGDSAIFSQATGLDPMVESSVGEFMLGTREQDG